MNTKSYTKQDLVREIAFTVGLTQKKARFVLDALQFIAYREAGNNGFTVPGLCRMDVVRRKERKMRNPQTGEKILIAEHNALRTRPIKKAKTAIAPPPENLITYMTTEKKAPEIYDDFSKAVSFRCKKCGQEIEAPLAAVGVESECPVCNTAITIPSDSEPGTMHGEPLPAPKEEPKPAVSEPAKPEKPALGTFQQKKDVKLESSLNAYQPQKTDSGKNQTIRIDLASLGIEEEKKIEPKRMISFFCKNCKQEIEAPTDMAGTSSDCPSCGVDFEIPFFSDKGTLHGSDLDQNEKELQEIKGRTIRIEVPDDI